jgi:hypothetical protein
MATRSSANHGETETRFNRSAWLVLIVVAVLMLGNPLFLAYRLTLPTDGWEVNEASDLPGFNYTTDLMGIAPDLQPGDQVIAIDGVSADWQIVLHSTVLQERWRAGNTLEYTVLRAGKALQIPITLGHWQIGPWLLALLRDPGQLAGLLSGFIVLALAWFVFLRRPGNPAAGAFLIIMVFLASSFVAETLPGGFATSLDPTAQRIQKGINQFVLAVLAPFAFIRLALVFPRPKPIYLRHPWLSYAAGAVGLVLTLAAPTSPLNWFWFVGSLLLTLAILVHNAFTMRDAVSRAQLRWGLGGFLIGIGILVMMFLAGTLGLVINNQLFFNVMPALSVTVMGSILAVSILRYRLFDIDVIIRKTLVYAMVTALLGLVYAGSVILLQQLFEAISGQQSPLAIVLSTLTIAALFNPLRRRVQNAVDWRFFRGKVDAAAAIAGFAVTARDETDVDALAAELTRVVQETMQPETVSLWMK